MSFRTIDVKWELRRVAKGKPVETPMWLLAELALHHWSSTSEVRTLKSDFVRFAEGLYRPPNTRTPA